MGESLLADVNKITKKLHKLMNTEVMDPNDVLKYLEYLNQLDMNLDVLTKTGVGLIINQIRKKVDDANIERLGKSLIKRWRTLVPSDQSAAVKHKSADSDGDNGTMMKRAKPDTSPSFNDESASPVSPSMQLSKVPYHNYFPTKSDYMTTDPVRIKSREMLRNALECGDVPEGCYDSEYLANQIENCVYMQFQDTDQKYRARLRSRIMNIRDKRNPELRQKLFMGYISAEQLANMSSEDMASDAMKRMRQKFTKEAIDEHQLSDVGGTETDLIKCRKCNTNKCVYTQLQTRSADEPMTTFVHCKTCGFRFKFN